MKLRTLVLVQARIMARDLVENRELVRRFGSPAMAFHLGAACARRNFIKSVGRACPEMRDDLAREIRRARKEAHEGPA